MNNKKGFTLIELIVALAIIGIVSAITIPFFTGHVQRAEQAVCEANRQIFMHSFVTNQMLDESDYTLQDALDGNYPAMVEFLDGLNCPADGTFSVVDGELYCSVHGAMSDSSGDTGGDTGEDPGGDSGTIEVGDFIYGNVTVESWNKLCSDTSDLPWGGTSVEAGTVYLLNGETYVVKNDNYLSVGAANTYADNPEGLFYMMKFDATASTVNSSNYNPLTHGWTPPLMNGTVFYENDESYVFLGADNTQYDVTPTIGGNWVKLK